MLKNHKDADAVPPDEEQELEARVDKMMDPKLPDDEPIEKPKDTGSEGLPAIDIFSDPKTAPEVPDEVLKVVTQDADDPVDTEKQEVEEAEEPKEEEKLLEANATPDAEDDPLDDPKIEDAVDEITAAESDAVLEAEDAKVQKAFEPKKPFGAKLKDFFAAWWYNRKARWATIIVLVIIIVVLAVVPTTRSFALNTVGVRGTAKVVVLDGTTSLPLKGVEVSIGGARGLTDGDGTATLSHVKLGSQALTAQKVAFASANDKVNVSWGNNDLGQVALKAVGVQYHFKLTDYVSGKPITAALATSGEANAIADKKGNIVLTLNNPDSSTINVDISSTGYRTEKVKVTVGSDTVTTLQMVPSNEEVFVSKQSGKYDVYKEDVDGKNKALLLPATGNENGQISLVMSPLGDESALVSTRDNVRDSGGYLEQALTLISVKDGSDLTIDHSDKIQIIDWIGNYLVYAEVKPGASAANPQRYQLISYNYLTKHRLLLAHANYFNDIVSADGVIYYAASNNYSGGVSQFAKVNPDNTGAQVLLTDDVWNIFRQGYNSFALSSATSWYTYELGDTKPSVTANAPANTTGRVYINSPDGKHSLWVDTRDGKGVLISYDMATKKDTTLVEQSGLTYPLRWLDNDTVIYRVTDSQETADYIVSLQGGQAKKIGDVTNVSGINRWYYY